MMIAGLVMASCLSLSPGAYSKEPLPGKSCLSVAGLDEHPHSAATREYLEKMTLDLGRGSQLPECLSSKVVTAVLEKPEQGIPTTDYNLVAKVIVLAGKRELLSRYLDFIIRTKGSADEGRSSGMGLLYTESAPVVLELLSKKPRDQRLAVIKSIAWGVANNFHPFLNQENFQRKIVGSNWEVLDPKYGHNNLVSEIEKAVRKILAS